MVLLWRRKDYRSLISQPRNERASTTTCDSPTPKAPIFSSSGFPSAVGWPWVWATWNKSILRTNLLQTAPILISKYSTIVLKHPVLYLQPGSINHKFAYRVHVPEWSWGQAMIPLLLWVLLIYCCHSFHLYTFLFRNGSRRPLTGHRRNSEAVPGKLENK